MIRPPTDKAVILAAGIGSRMRNAAPAVDLTPEQRAAADLGIKGMIPIRRPFLDYLLHTLADAGFHRICLVIGPSHQQIRDYYEALPTQRLKISFAIQPQPRGTADAVAAAESFAADDLFLTINSDNYYPLNAFRALRALHEPATIAFDRDALLRFGNIAPERIARYAILSARGDSLQRVVEKPDPAFLASLQPPIGVSMNCWLMPPTLFKACREIPPSPRGEFELTDAVNHLLAQGERFRVLPVSAPVLDLSSRDDIPAVAAQLADLEVNL